MIPFSLRNRPIDPLSFCTSSSSSSRFQLRRRTADLFAPSLGRGDKRGGGGNFFQTSKAEEDELVRVVIAGSTLQQVEENVPSFLPLRGGEKKFCI